MVREILVAKLILALSGREVREGVWNAAAR